jgi:hypothetical protein
MLFKMAHDPSKTAEILYEYDYYEGFRFKVRSVVYRDERGRLRGRSLAAFNRIFTPASEPVHQHH